MSELSQKGENIYQTHILPNLAVEKLKGKIVAIETESWSASLPCTNLGR